MAKQSPAKTNRTAKPAQSVKPVTKPATVVPTPTVQSAKPSATELPAGPLGRAVYDSDAFNGQLFARLQTGCTKSDVLTMARNAGTALALRLEPIIKHSRSIGKRGLRWTVTVNGKPVHSESAFTMGAFNALPATAKIAVINVRPATNKTYVDSMGVTKLADRIAMVNADA